MKTVRYKQFRHEKERLWLTRTRINGDTVIGRVSNHPVKPGLIFGQLIGVPFKCHTRWIVLVLRQAIGLSVVIIMRIRLIRTAHRVQVQRYTHITIRITASNDICKGKTCIWRHTHLHMIIRNNEHQLNIGVGMVLQLEKYMHSSTQHGLVCGHNHRPEPKCVYDS